MRFSKISRKIVSKGKEFEDFTRWTCDVNNVLNQHFFQFPFSLFTAYQILRSERKNRSYFLSAILKCRIEKQNCTLRGLRKENWQSIWLFSQTYAILPAHEWIRTWVCRFRFFTTVFDVKTEQPHVWPFTDLDYVETVWRRVQESIGCGHERLGNAWKVNKKLSIMP